MNEKIDLYKTYFGHFHAQAILTQNIQTSSYIQINFALKVSKHKPLYVKLIFNQRQS